MQALRPQTFHLWNQGTMDAKEPAARFKNSGDPPSWHMWTPAHPTAKNAAKNTWTEAAILQPTDISFPTATTAQIHEPTMKIRKIDISQSERQSDGTAAPEPDLILRADRRLPYTPCWLLFISSWQNWCAPLVGFAIAVYMPLFVLADRMNSRMSAVERNAKLLLRQQSQEASKSQTPSSPESAPSYQSPDQSNQ